MATVQRAFLSRGLPRSQSLLDFGSVGSLTVVVKLAGAIKVALSARVFGLSDALDAYFIAFSISSLVCDGLAGGLIPALVPQFVKQIAEDGARAVHADYGGTLYRSVLLLSGAGALVLICSGPILHVFASGFSSEKLALTRNLLLVLAPIFPLTGITAVWRSLLNSESRFAVPAICPVMTPLIATAFLSISGRLGGIYALALGSTAGAFAEVLVLALYFAEIQIPVVPRWSRTLMDAHWLRRDYFPLVLSNLVQGGVNLVDQGIAALLAPGSVAALGLGTRLVAVVMAIGPATLSTIFLPKLSRMAAIGDWRLLRRTVTRSLILCISGMSLLTALLIAFSSQLAHLAFQKGSSTGMDIHLLSVVQSFSFLQLPFTVGSVILIRVIVSLRMNRSLLFFSIFALVANTALDLCLIPFFGVGGVTLSTGIVQGLTFAALLRCVYRVLIDKTAALPQVGLNG